MDNIVSWEFWELLLWVIIVVGGGSLAGYLLWLISPERKRINDRLAEIKQNRINIRKQLTDMGIPWNDCKKCGYLMIYKKKICEMCGEKN